MTENQKLIAEALRKKSKIIKADKLFKELGLKDMAQFIKDLNAIEQAGEIVISKKGGIQSVEGAGLIKGKIISMSKYFSFMQPDDGGEDVYIPCEQNGGSLPGDRVIISRRMDVKGYCGKVLRIYEHGSRLVTGTLKKFRGKLEFHADTYYRVPIEVAKNKIGARAGDKVQAKIFLSKDGRDVTCAVDKIYGNSECARICADAIIDAFGIPSKFGREVLDCAEEIGSQPIRQSDIQGRTDLRGENIFTIDGADAKDLDDAICVKKIAEGFELSVHIADVSHYVKDESPLDKEALLRGTSVYFADRVIPMYPEAISNGICSLNAHTDKLAFSAFMTFDKQGKMLDYHFAKTIINSKVRGVYSEVNSILDGTASDDIVEKYAPVRGTIADAYELYRILKSSSDKRGSVHFTSTESRFVLDENGVCIGLKARETGQAEEMIEQFMISANIAAAMLARKAQIPFVYRVHESPNPEALDRVSQLLGIIGVNSTALRSNPSPSDVDAILLAVKDTKYEQVVSNVMLRAMSKARYDYSPLGHFGLALEDYCHFTSPIRRYPDSFIHRVLSAYVAGEKTSEIVKKFDHKASEAAKISSEYEVRAVNAERRTEDCYMAEYMSKFIGEDFDGVICSVTENGFFVRLENSAEGYVRIEDLPSDSYKFDGFAMLRGMRGGRKYSVGDTIKIRVAAVGISVGKIDFVPADKPGLIEQY